MRSCTVAAAVVLGCCWLAKAVPTGQSPPINHVETQTVGSPLHKSTTSLGRQKDDLRHETSPSHPAHLLPRNDDHVLIPAGVTTSERQILPTATQEIYGGLFVFDIASSVNLLEVFVATYDPASDSWVQGYTVQCDEGQKAAKLRVYAPAFKITPVRFVTIFSRQGSTVILSLKREPMILHGDEVEVTGKETRSVWWELLGESEPDLSKDASPIVLRPNMPPRLTSTPIQPWSAVGSAGGANTPPSLQGGQSSPIPASRPVGQGEGSRPDPNTPSPREGLSAPLLAGSLGGQER